jgi:FkbM family methyltransferase
MSRAKESNNLKGEPLPRVRFDLSLTNAIRRVRLRGERSAPFAVRARQSEESAGAGEAQQASRPTTKPAFSGGPSPIGRAARLLLAPFRRPARFLRNFLVAGIEQKIDQANASIEQIQAGIIIINSGFAKQEIQLSAKIDALQIKSDELAVRTGTPIQVDDFTVAVRTADGFVLVPRSDMLLLLLLCDAGLQGLEPGTRKVLTRLLAPGMMFVDVGAHVGLLTLAGARAVGPHGRVLALEPTPATFELLVRALAINGVGGRVLAQCLACGARRERRAFHLATVLGHSSLLAPTPGSSEQVARVIEVDVVLLDDIVPAGNCVDVVKIDVEGTELDVLAGMTRIIRESPDLAIIAEFGPAHLARAGITPDAWFKAFYMHGLEAYAIHELSGECRRAHQPNLAAVESINILFCRPNSKPAARIKT